MTPDITDYAGKFDISEEEAARIWEVASNMNEFIEIWENTDWWREGATD